ncbi:MULTISPECIES: hypothetical protein [unclassified Shinella]|uniref:hypothetical protein n=1 Tax=unclassified Shinella TaxID=2643062 RepID=UPI00225D46F4|nr:hypothetical protein SHINE37_110263 [Rhizobiaceae bacterium]
MDKIVQRFHGDAVGEGDKRVRFAAAWQPGKAAERTRAETGEVTGESITGILDQMCGLYQCLAHNRTDCLSYIMMNKLALSLIVVIIEKRAESMPKTASSLPKRACAAIRPASRSRRCNTLALAIPPSSP